MSITKIYKSLLIIIDIYQGSSTHPKVVSGRSCIRSNWNLEMLIFEERRKPQNPEKNLQEQSKGPTTNLTHSWPEPGPRRWEASAITTTPSLLPSKLILSLQMRTISPSSVALYLLGRHSSRDGPKYPLWFTQQLYRIIIGEHILTQKFFLGNLSVFVFIVFFETVLYCEPRHSKIILRDRKKATVT